MLEQLEQTKKWLKPLKDRIGVHNILIICDNFVEVFQIMIDKRVDLDMLLDCDTFLKYVEKMNVLHDKLFKEHSVQQKDNWLKRWLLTDEEFKKIWNVLTEFLEEEH